MPVLPYHKYIGPGNKLDSSVLPVDSDDRIALEHDQAYARGSNIREADSHAIHDFIGDFADTGNLHSVLGALGLQAKRTVEGITGQLYPRNRGDTMSHRNHPYHRPQSSQADSSQGSGPPRTPGHFLSQESQAPLPDTPGHFLSQSSMDFSQNEAEAGPSQSSQLSLGMGTAPGAGSGTGGMGTNVTDVFNCTSAPGTPFKRHYKKVYRFVQPASLTAFRRLSHAEGDQVEFVEYKIGSSTVLPLQQIFFYMDPREYKEITEHMGSFRVEHVNATVHSLGVRVPFNTAQTNIEVANNNLHIPVMDISPLAEKYYIRPTAGFTDDQANWAAMIRGEKHYNFAADSPSVAATEDWNTSFPNIAPYSETRIVRSRCVIRLPFIENAAGTGMDVIGYTHAFPQIMLNCKKMILGSNYLGPAFHWSHKGSRLIWKRSNITGLPLPTFNVTTGATLERNQMRSTTRTKVANQNHSSYETSSAGGRIIMQPQQVMPQGGMPKWSIATIDGYDVASSEYRFQPLIFCQYNIRNFLNDVETDSTTPATGANSIINTSFEYLLECNMTAEGSYIAPIYYNLHPFKPTPDHFNPHLILATDALAAQRPLGCTGATTFHQPTITSFQENGADDTASIPPDPAQ